MAPQVLMATPLIDVNDETTAAAAPDVTGVVRDKVSNTPIVGALVRVKGQQKMAATDENGAFNLNLKQGRYELEVSYLGYKPMRTEVIVLGRGKNNVLEVQLEENEQLLGLVTVTAKRNHENETDAMTEQRNTVEAVQTVGAAELSRKGISDAAGAVEKVAGIAKQEGEKNVFVRGLGDRYNATTLNGFPLPSEDPEYKNISLDFFGSDLIQAVGVNKAFTAAGAADVAGAGIDILSKTLTTDAALSIDLSAGGNSSTLGADFLKMDGVGFGGFVRHQQPGRDAADNPTFNFRNRLDPKTSNFQLNHGLGIAGGRRFYLNENPLTFYVVANHSTDYEHYDEQVREATNGGALLKDYAATKSRASQQQLVLANVDLNLNNLHNLAYNFMLVHASQVSVGDYLGMDSDEFQAVAGNLGFRRRQQANDNLLLVNQFLSRWRFAPGWDLDAGLAFNHIVGREPDRRMNSYQREGDNAYTLIGSNTQKRFFSQLNQNDFNARAVLTYKFTDDNDDASAVSGGYRFRQVNDDFEVNEYDLSPYSGSSPTFASFNQLDSFYTDANFAADRFVLTATAAAYEAQKSVHTAFAEGTWQFSPALVGQLGLKMDNVNLDLDYSSNGVMQQDNSTHFSKTFFLPSLNLKWNFRPEQALRLSLSKTYTMPQSKELSRYIYVGENFNSQGNAGLRPSDNYNLDLKWDYYLSPNEIVSATLFYKHIENPIARAYDGSGAGILSYANISDKATVAGVEVELRKQLLQLGDTEVGEHRLTAGVNGSYIFSEAKLQRIQAVDASFEKTQLEGATPWMANADLSYAYRRGEQALTATLVYNFKSKTLNTTGRAGFADLMTNDLHTLDLVASYALNKHWKFSAKAKNLLNARYELTRENVGAAGSTVLNSFRRGIDASVGVSYTF